MSYFKEMNRDRLLKLLEGHEDTLTKRVQEELDFVTRNPCVRCGATVYAEIDTQRTLNNGGVKTFYLCRCTVCKCLFSPYTGMLVEMGNLGNLEPAIPIVQPHDD